MARRKGEDTMVAGLQQQPLVVGMPLSSAELEDVGNPGCRCTREGPRIQRCCAYSSRIPGDRRQPLGHKRFGVAQLSGERRRLYPSPSGAALMLHQDFT